MRHDPTSPLLTTTPRYPSTASALRELGSSVHAPPPPVAATVKLLLLCGNSASALAFLDAYSTVPFEAKDTAVLRAAVLLELGRVEEAHRLCPRLCQEKLWHQGEFWRLLSVSVGGDYTEGSGDRIPGSIVRFFVERVRDAAEAGSKKDVAVSLLVSYFLQKGRVREAAAVHLDALGAPRSSEGRRAFKKRESLVRGALEIHGHRGEAALGTAAAGVSIAQFFEPVTEVPSISEEVPSSVPPAPVPTFRPPRQFVAPSAASSALAMPLSTLPRTASAPAPDQLFAGIAPTASLRRSSRRSSTKARDSRTSKASTDLFSGIEGRITRSRASRRN